MFIQTEDTPNPNTLKFLPGGNVLKEGTAEFTSPESALKSNLANLLFEVQGVTRVFFGLDFISVTKEEKTQWDVLKPSILTSIMEHYASGKPLIEKVDEHNEIANISEADTEVVKQIKELIDERVRPAVAMDGGDIVFCSYSEGVVTLQMRGACAGCPSSTATLKMGIENMLKHYIPEVKEVQAAGV
mgnify:CR=1 FL=1